MWLKHVIEARREAELTDKLLEFLNSEENLSAPGRVIVREQEKKISGPNDAFHPYTLTILHWKPEPQP
jgi:hypothetical protein